MMTTIPTNGFHDQGVVHELQQHAEQRGRAEEPVQPGHRATQAQLVEAGAHFPPDGRVVVVQ